MSFDKLALEYMTAKDAIDLIQTTGDQKQIAMQNKIMDLADDIACARFGVGFYEPKA